MEKDKLKELMNRFQEAKRQGKLKGSSEATVRTWVDELLHVFGWNVQNTHQVLTERSLGLHEKKKLKEIGSTNTRPDYTLVNGTVAIAFLDAKNLSVNIDTDKGAAFQIRSYGWSIGASFSILTNMEQIAIYDCTVMPHVDDDACVARHFLISSDEYVSKYDTLRLFLSRDCVLADKARFVQSKGESLDERFAKILGATRISLANAILESNGNQEMTSLSFYVQTIIDRILFIRVCESRGLEEEGLLMQFEERGFWKDFKKSSYADFYEKYDGPMFKKISNLQDLVISNEVFEEFLRHLYYPSPYRFDVIPLTTLSDIYDLFLGYELIMRDGIVKDQLRSEFKKTNGAVTTPNSLVRQVIESTMPTSQLEKLDLNELFNLKIADIACGSGAFLIGAYDHLAKVIEHKLSEDDGLDTECVVAIDGKPSLTIEGRRKIINQCIFGVDINPEATEVAKLSLSLKLIDSYSPRDFEAVGLLGSQILKGVGHNIKCGNSLVEPDIEELYPEMSNDIDQLQITNAFDWKRSYPTVFGHGGFDFIIGNPPYVEVKNYNEERPYMAAYIKHTYRSSKNGKIDLAIPFIERGLGLLNEHGRLGYIIQKRFFKTDYGKGIRKLLTDQNVLNGIYDYEETDLFHGYLTYVAILVCDKDLSHNSNIWYINSKESKGKVLPKGLLSGTPWNLGDLRLNTLRLNLAEKLGTLKDICTIKVGIQTLWNDAYQISADHVREGIITGCTKIDEHVAVEKDACRPVICNENFEPLTRRNYTTYAIFPYAVGDDGAVRELSIREYADKYPKAGEYLCRNKSIICENVETLPQKHPSYDESSYWHLYTRANNHGAVYPKICIPMTSKTTQASVVMDRHVYCDNANMFFVQAAETDETFLYALAGLINSTIFNTLARSIANPQQGGYYKFNRQFLDPVPVPVKAFLSRDRNVCRLAKVSKQIERINEKLSEGPGVQQSGLIASLKKKWEELDSICDKLYGIKNSGDKALLYAAARKDRHGYGQED